jgi:hypothetical protein
MIVLIIIVFIGLLQTSVFQQLVVERFDNISQGTDGSSSHRILGAFEILKVLENERFFMGNGLGQLNPYFASVRVHFEHFYIAAEDAPNIGLNNMLSQITIDTGIIGLIIFLSFIFSFTKRQIVYFIVFVVFCFSWGFFNTPFFWFYIYMSNVLIEKSKTIEYEISINNLRFLRKYPSVV